MKDQKNSLSVPVAIIISGVLISFSIYASKAPMINVRSADQDATYNSQIEPLAEVDIKLRPVDRNDHIRGSLSATVKIVEFSDPECPFCKMFHSTMKQVMSEYGAGNKVAWVYRNFPLDSLHPKARKEAEALECANELGGNSKFWSYVDRLMEITPSNNQLDPAKLYEIADYVKLNPSKFKSCLDSGRYAKKIQADVDDATSAGGRGTPYSVIVGANGKKFPVDGAVSYESLKTIIDQALEISKSRLKF